tara:strand:+ start:91 stop:495 length:405 start_codon:yes stop_codon:yes gene_type:complete
MLKGKNRNFKDSQVLAKGGISMSEFLEKLNQTIVANDESVSGNLDEVVQSLDQLQGKGTPTEIAKVMFGTSNPSYSEKRKIRNICQNKGLSLNKDRIISLKGGRFLILRKNASGREKNLYLVAKDEKHAKQLIK